MNHSHSFIVQSRVSTCLQHSPNHVLTIISGSVHHNLPKPCENTGLNRTKPHQKASPRLRDFPLKFTQWKSALVGFRYWLNVDYCNLNWQCSVPPMAWLSISRSIDPQELASNGVRLKEDQSESRDDDDSPIRWWKKKCRRDFFISARVDAPFTWNRGSFFDSHGNEEIPSLQVLNP